MGKAELRQVARTERGQLAVILNKNPDTEILMEGHSDSDGNNEFIGEISIRRVEIAIFANDKLKAAAKKQAGEG